MGGGLGAFSGGQGDWFSSQSMALGVAAMTAAASSDPGKMGQMMSSALGIDGASVSGGNWLTNKMSILKQYFNVTHSYVRWKLLFVMFPFLPSANAGTVTRSVSRSVPSTDEEDSTGLRLYPGRRPDLYVPLMGYISYILVYGLSRGKNFHPDDLYNIASLAGVLALLEVLLVKGGSYILAVPTLNLTDIVAVCGYKFSNLCFSVLVLIFLGESSRTIWTLLWIWAALTAAVTVHRGIQTAANFNASSSNYMGTGSANSEKLVALASAVSQLLWCWFLMPAFIAAPTAVPPAGIRAVHSGFPESTG